MAAKRQKPVGNPWEDRIVGYGKVEPGQLLANPNNYKIHPRSQQQAFEEVAETVGIVAPVIVNQRTGFVVDGHMRVASAISTHQPTVPVAFVDLSDAEELQVLLTFDPLGAMALSDKAQVTELLGRVTSTGKAMDALLGKWAEDSHIISGVMSGASRFEPPEENTDEEEWPTTQLRIIITFDSEDEARECFRRLGWAWEPTRILYRWRDGQQEPTDAEA